MRTVNHPATIEADLGPVVAVVFADGSRAVVPVEAVVIPCAERT